MIEPKLFTSYDEFNEYTKYIEKDWDKYETKIFYIMRFGYTLKECKECKWYIIETEIDYDSSCFIWDWDWYEGEQYIELLTVATDEDIKNMLIKNKLGDEKP